MTIRRIARWIAAVLLVCLGLVVVLLVVATTPWFKERVRGLIVTRVSGLMEAELQVGALTGSLFGNVTLHDVVVRQGGQLVMQVGAVQARYDVIQLALGRMAIDEVAIRQPALRLVETAEGWNVTRLFRPRERQPDSAPWSVAINDLTVANGSLVVEPLDASARAVADLNLEGDLRYGESGLGITLERLSVRDERTGLQVTQLAGDFSVNDLGFRVSDLVLSTPASEIRGHAAYRWGDEALVDAAVELVRVTPLELTPYLPAGVAPSVPFTGRASARGPIEAVVATWDLTSTAGSTSGRMTVGLDRPGQVQVNGTASVDRLDLGPMTGDNSLTSVLTARADVRGVIDQDAPVRSRLTFTLVAPRVRLLGYEATALDASGSLAGRALDVKGKARAYGAAATFDATIQAVDDAAARRVTASGQLSALDLQTLPPALSAPDIATDIAGAYSVAFSRDHWRAAMTTERSRIEDAIVAAGTVVWAESQPDRFTATLSGEVSGVGGELLRLPEGRTASLGGTVQARVALPGLARPIALERIDADVTANLSGSTLEGVRLETAQIDASLANGIADVRQLELHATDLDLSAQGIVAVADDGQASDLTLTAGITDLSRLEMVGLDELTGALHLEGVVTGPPGALAASGAFNAHQLKYGEAVDALTANGTFKAAVPDRDWARLTAGVALESEFLTIRDYDIERLTLTAQYQSGQVDIAGRIEQKQRAIDLDSFVVLHPDHQEIHLRQMTIAGPGSPWELGGNEAVIHYGAETVSVKGLTFVRGQERLEASGLLAFSGTKPSDLQLRFQGIQVGDLYAMAFGAPLVTGVAGGDFVLRGVLPNPEVTGRLEVVGGQVAQVPYTQAAANVKFSDRRLALDARIDEPNGSVFTVTGTVPVAADAGSLDVRVQSAGVSLGLAQAFTSHLQNVQGQALIDVQATGALDAPLLNGRVAIVKGGFLLTATGVSYQNLDADIVLEGRRATTRQFTVSDDDGHVLTMTAGADVFANGQDRAFEVAIEADSLQVIQNDLGDVEVDIQVRAEGSLAAPRLTGRIAMDQGRLEVDEILRRVGSRGEAPSELRAELPAAGAEAAASSETPPLPSRESAPPGVAPVQAASQPRPAADQGLFSRATMDLDIAIPDALVLRGQDVRAGAGSMALGNLNVTIGGNLDLTKAAGAEPVIQGSLGVVRGFYEFQGRRFDVTRGSSISFRGPDPANPALNVTGERTVQGVIARVQVTGTLRQPRLALSSDPPLDEGDVLSLIVFNQPINQLGEAEQVDLLERAGALAVGTLATSLSESLGDALDVDLFEIRAPGSGAAGEVTVGRQVNDRLFIGFRQEFAGGEASHLSFEYQLTDALRILTSVAQGVERAKRSRNQDTAGIDLIYQIRY